MSANIVLGFAAGEFVGFIDSGFAALETGLPARALVMGTNLGVGKALAVLFLEFFGCGVRGACFGRFAGAEFLVELCFAGGEILNDALEPIKQGQGFRYARKLIHSLF